MKVAIFIFRRDLRITDNSALLEATKNNDRVIPIFIFDHHQINNINKESASYKLLIAALHIIKLQIPLIVLHSNEKTPVHLLVLKLMELYHAQSVYFNFDWSPYALKRDLAIKKMVESKQGVVHVIEDSLLSISNPVKTESHKIYSKFTPWYDRVVILPISKPKPFSQPNKLWKPHGIKSSPLPPADPMAIKQIKEKTAIGYLQNVRHSTTSELSAMIKFGIISVRTAYHYFSEEQRRQLYWQSFYAMHCCYGYLTDSVLSIKWPKITRTYFKAWQTGTTGFPFIDAPMRELIATGRMHNRFRLMVANFLVKDLLIDWRFGELHFAQHLEDIDYANNRGNWLWVASIGHDSQPYFRSFNPDPTIAAMAKSIEWSTEDAIAYLKKWLKDEIQITDSHHTYSRKQIINHKDRTDKWNVWFTTHVIKSK